MFGFEASRVFIFEIGGDFSVFGGHRGTEPILRHVGRILFRLTDK